jgi:predicted amidohydrolase
MAYDLVIYIANWPAARIQAWDSLLRARAIENGCYSIGVNRVGKDGNGILYNGHTAAFDPTGKKMITLKQESGMKTIKLSLKTLQRYREKFPFYLDNDHFELN